MVPVFTPLNQDLSVNLDIIPDYAQYLKKKKLSAVLVNGTTGEGMSMSVEERKATAEKWVEAGKKFDLEVMVQIAGAPSPDVVALAKHAEEIGVKSVLCLPELYFKPKTEEELVDYLYAISLHCPNVAVLYYHIPSFTRLNLFMPKFCKLARERIPNFAGIKYTSGDLEKIVPTVDGPEAIFIGSDLILTAALALGFDSAIMTTLNIYPEIAHGIVGAMKEGDLIEARQLQKKLNRKIEEITSKGNWVDSMKHEFNRVAPDLHLGLTRC